MQNKDIKREIASFGLAAGDLDAVLVNVGNGPELTLDSIASTADKLKGSGALFLWLTTFEGNGRIDDPVKKKKLGDMGVIYVSPFVLTFDYV